MAHVPAQPTCVRCSPGSHPSIFARARARIPTTPALHACQPLTAVLLLSVLHAPVRPSHGRSLRPTPCRHFLPDVIILQARACASVPHGCCRMQPFASRTRACTPASLMPSCALRPLWCAGEGSGSMGTFEDMARDVSSHGAVQARPPGGAAAAEARPARAATGGRVRGAAR